MLLLPVAIWSTLVWQPAALALITVIPRGSWLLPGLLLALVTWNWQRRFLWRAMLVVWTLFACCYLEETQSLLRNVTPVTASDGSTLRFCILSVNCSSNGGVLGDLLPLQPDLVLIQESPSESQLHEWGEQLWGEDFGVVFVRDCAILARGKLVAIPPDAQGICAIARWQPGEGKEILVTSLRLWPQPLRIDFWNRDCWSSFAFVRRRQIEQVAEVSRLLRTGAGEGPVLVGGDFNSPAGDISEQPLNVLGLSEAFAIAGRGWGKTITSDYPFHRIDRIWVSREFSAVSVTAHPARNTDHRIVKCLVDLPTPTD